MKFDWDEGNRDKNLRHGVQDREIEEALLDRRAISLGSSDRHGEERHVLLGRAQTSGKYLRIIYTVRMVDGEELIRPISAYEMAPAERARYRGRR